jgi:putative ubiquitin-RnfH superfamily antitoxin RatB of RatAB toxin-antitoxin module
MVKPPPLATTGAGPLRITVCYSPSARVVHTLELVLPLGACVRDAVALCAADARFATALQSAKPLNAPLGGLGGLGAVHCAVWGTKALPDQLLKDLDRVELCRPLRVDPKVARRERFAKQGARTSGLFATRRPGAKPGY